MIIPNKDLKLIIKIAATAPSGMNEQPWHFIIIKDKNLQKLMANIAVRKWEGMLQTANQQGREDLSKRFGKIFIQKHIATFAEAPVTIAVVLKAYYSPTKDLLEESCNNPEDLSKLYPNPPIQAIGATTQNLILAANALGYGTCWMTGPICAANELEKLLHVEPPDQITALIPIGIPNENPVPTSRKQVEEIMTYI
jgi:nitroreductase